MSTNAHGGGPSDAKVHICAVQMHGDFLPPKVDAVAKRIHSMPTTVKTSWLSNIKLL